MQSLRDEKSTGYEENKSLFCNQESISKSAKKSNIKLFPPKKYLVTNKSLPLNDSRTPGGGGESLYKLYRCESWVFELLRSGIG